MVANPATTALPPKAEPAKLNPALIICIWIALSSSVVSFELSRRSLGFVEEIPCSPVTYHCLSILTDSLQQGYSRKYTYLDYETPERMKQPD